MLIAAVLWVGRADRMLCTGEPSLLGWGLANAPATATEQAINYVLADKQGVMRDPCHKRETLFYIASAARSKRIVNFDHSKIIPYVGMYMENRYSDLEYHEAIRAAAIYISSRIRDRKFHDALRQFYASDPESQRFVEETTYGDHQIQWQ